MTVVCKHSVRPVCLCCVELFSAYPDYTTPNIDHHFFEVQLSVPVILLLCRNYKRVYTIQLYAIHYIWSPASVLYGVCYALQSFCSCEKIEVEHPAE